MKKRKKEFMEFEPGMSDEDRTAVLDNNIELAEEINQQSAKMVDAYDKLVNEINAILGTGGLSIKDLENNKKLDRIIEGLTEKTRLMANNFVDEEISKTTNETKQAKGKSQKSVRGAVSKARMKI